MVCQTIASRPVEPGKESELSRDEIQCKIIYAANGEEDAVEALVMYQPPLWFGHTARHEKFGGGLEQG